MIAVIVGKKDKIKAGTVQKFAVPKGKVMVQILMNPKTAGSVFGRALTFAKRHVMQWRVSDSTGQNYWPLGEVRIARTQTGGRVEIQYNPEADIPERALKPAKSVSEKQLLSSDSLVVFLFLVPEKAEITAFKAQKKEYTITF